MYKFIQRKQKTFLAIFGVLLMIVFILPVGMNQMRADPESLLYGRSGEEKITRGDLRQAHNDIETLKRWSVMAFTTMDGLTKGTGEVLGTVDSTTSTDIIVATGGQKVAIKRDQILRTESRHFRPFWRLDPTFRAIEEMFRMQGRPVEGEQVLQNASGFLPTIEKFLAKPETYVLLQREARAAGITPSSAEVEELFVAYFQPGLRNANDAAAYRATLERFLLVRDFHDRMVANIKVTRPIAREFILRSQQPTINLVEFHAADFLAETTAPTEAQILSHYNQHATALPSPTFLATSRQPLQFAYRLSDKLKLQYLELPLNDLMTAAIKELKPADLLPVDSVAFAYFGVNQDKFQTDPATKPVFGPIGPTTTPATAPTGPTTRPFGEVRSDLRRQVLSNDITSPNAAPEDVVAAQLVRQRVEARVEQLRKEIRDRLAKDFTDASAANQFGKIEKIEYLETVAGDFEKAHGVRPVVKSLASDFLSLSDLAALPGIGGARAEGMPFSVYATRHAGATTQPATTLPSSTQPASKPATPATASAAVPATSPTTNPSTQPAVEATKPAKSALALLEPSPVLMDGTGNAFIFRLTAFEGEHVPTLEEARPAIVKDLKLVAAYDAARKKAMIVREAAGSAAANSQVGGLPVVSPPVKEVGPITSNDTQFPGYDTKDVAVQEALGNGVNILTNLARTDLPHPSTVVELPSKQTAVVMELRVLERRWTAEEDAEMQAQIISVARGQIMQEPGIREALQSWFDPESVMTRMKFKKE